MMTTGEMDYDGIFHLNLDSDSNDTNELPFAPIAYILWIPFVILMPVLFANMLVRIKYMYYSDCFIICIIIVFRLDWLSETHKMF